MAWRWTWSKELAARATMAQAASFRGSAGAAQWESICELSLPIHRPRCYKRRVSSRQHHPHLRGVAILCALCTAAVLVLHGTSVSYQLFEMQMRDHIMRSFTRRARVDPRLVYLALDADTMNVADKVFADDLATSPPLRKMAAGWPWPHDVQAMIIERLLQAGAKVVALDILFPFPRDGDAELKRVLDRYPERVVIGSNFTDAETTGASRTLTVRLRI